VSSVATVNYWTPAEDAAMRAHYAAGNLAAIVAATGRSIHSIRHRAKILRLVCRPERHWTPAADARLSEAWGHVKTHVLAKELGRSPSALKQRAIKLQLDAERCYTAEDLATLREMYPTHTAAQIAERIHGSGRCALAIYRMAAKLGLRKCPRLDPELIERVRVLLTTEDLTDMQAARRLNLTREQITHIRHTHLHIGRNETALLVSRRRAVKTQYASLGIRTAGELRALSYRRFAVENGWPEDLRPRAVQILNWLAAHRSGTAREIAEGIGMPTSTTFRSGKRRILLASNDKPGGTYTAELRRRGLVLYIARSAGPGSGKGGGHIAGLYTLSPLAIATIEEFNDERERRGNERTCDHVSHRSAEA
jgi:hypothetical protein